MRAISCDLQTLNLAHGLAELADPPESSKRHF
jgi:hypothetical protein